jgi:hypothetical protein
MDNRRTLSIIAQGSSGSRRQSHALSNNDNHQDLSNDLAIENLLNRRSSRVS